MPLTRKQLTQLRSADAAPNRLREAMQLAEVTQVVLAGELSITQSHVSEIVNGNYSRLPLDTAQRFAVFFGCAVEDLFPAREAVA